MSPHKIVVTVDDATAADRGEAGASNAPPGPRRPSLHTVLPFVVGLVCFLLLAILNQARGFDLWRNYALSGVFLGSITTWVVWRYDVRIPHYIQWVIVAGLLLHYGGGSLGSPDPFRVGLFGFHGINGAYHTIEGWDHITHGVGIGAGAMALAYLLELYQVRRRLHWNASTVWFLAVLTSLAVGVGVELYEFLGKSAFQTIDQGGYENTMRDLHYNILGAVVGGGVAAFVDRRRFGRRIERLWGQRPPTGPSYPGHIPPAMAGLIAFVAPAAIATVYLSLRFVGEARPADDIAAYDDALRTLLSSAVLGTVLGPLVGLLWRGRSLPEGTP